MRRARKQRDSWQGEPGITGAWVNYIRLSEYICYTPGMLDPHLLCRCLSDATRFALMSELADGEEACVCELVDALGAPQPTVSRHLGELRRCGLVVTRREGTWMHYRLNPALPPWASEVIATLAGVAPAPAKPLPHAC